MNRSSKSFKLVAGVAILCGFSFWLGKTMGSDEAFERGVKLESQRSARYKVGEIRWLLMLSDSGRAAELRDSLVNGMWSSIVQIDALSQNPDASPEEREAASGLLSKLVEYFYNNPRKIVGPKDVDISDEVDRELRAEENSMAADSKQREVMRELREASKVPMEQMDVMLGGLLREAHKFDLETQAVLERHISQRNFPGWTRVAAGITFIIPPDSGGSRISSDEFRFDGKKTQILYEGGRLRINNQDFGTVLKGSVVDLRLPGRVYVNDLERHPKTQEKEEDE